MKSNLTDLQECFTRRRILTSNKEHPIIEKAAAFAAFFVCDFCVQYIFDFILSKVYCIISPMSTVAMTIIGSILIGYFLGCINLSYIISRIKGFDIRKYGSGNAGASNVMIVIGKKVGAFVAIFDILKAFLAVKLAGLCFFGAVVGDLNYAGCIAGASAIIGHIMPFYMNFRGGKGLAAFGGTLLAVDYRLFFVLFIISLFIAIITDYICFVPISMAVVVPLSVGMAHDSYVPTLILSVSSVAILCKHIENIKRIKAGEELRFHFLWKRGDEAERFGIIDDGKDIFSHEIK